MNPQDLILDLPRETKNKVIWRLCELVARNHRLPAGALYKTVMERERLGSTALEQGVALPHGRSPQVGEVTLAFGRSRPGLLGDGHDPFKIHLIFLMLVPERAAGEHLAVLSTLGRLLGQAELRNNLLAAETPEQVIEILNSF